jgi:hypothetical protein
MIEAGSWCPASHWIALRTHNPLRDTSVTSSPDAYPPYCQPMCMWLMNVAGRRFLAMSTEAAILTGASLATLGWLYTARRARTLARKQHTINVVFQGDLNEHLRNSFKGVMMMIRRGKCPDLFTEENADLRWSFQTIANHFEFIAAGIRNGDFDERLVMDSLRGTTEWGHDFIWKLRDTRRRTSSYEHLEWLHNRWEKHPPNRVQRLIEWVRGYPFAGTRVNPHL